MILFFDARHPEPFSRPTGNSAEAALDPWTIWIGAEPHGITRDGLNQSWREVVLFHPIESMLTKDDPLHAWIVVAKVI
jgi:hypothetical protein